MLGVEGATSSVLAEGVLVPGGTLGIHHRSFAFEWVARGLESYVASAAPEERQRLFLSGVQARETLERSGYLSSFPNLVGAISTLDEERARKVLRDPEHWRDELEASEVTLCSAACHGLYPLLAGSVVPEAGATFEVQCWCFRHEPSEDLARSQWFRQHEFVLVGSPEQALEHRDRWRSRAVELLGALGLEVEVVVANDPFFGRAAAMLAEGQRDKALKFEVVAEVAGSEPRAIASTNYHEDHFGTAFSLRLEDGSAAHTACIGFGLERISLALFRRHGADVGDWPNDVRAALGGGLTTARWGAAR